ncbi:DUF5677 domain-containing protein [uncultured Jatrophihabitans sp.]|uniref:DUF5677 domain-containing protein n=1 Tax=uncultured Jatrophihabitans sp. TaxID=1610747 RepID=UPI0035CA0C07
MSDHVRKGRVFKSPLAATGVLEIGDWFRDDLPDLIWPALVLAERNTTDAVRFMRWQQDVLNDLADSIEPQFVADCLDGRLTSLDRLAARDSQAEAIVRTRASERGLLTESVVRALTSYPLRPAGWLVGPDFQPPDQATIDLLARALREAIADGHREAVIKCLRIWSNLQAGTFSSSATTIELLRPYPGDLSTRRQADSAIRAMWGAHRGMLMHDDANHYDAAIKWARVFWGANSMTTRCVRQRDRVSHISDNDADPDFSADGDPSAPSEVPTDGTHLRQLAMDLLSSYVEALECAPARLHDHERQEVHAGLVARAGRDLITALGAPDLWCMEHGSHIIRVLVEVRIYLQWMATQDETIYRSFQEYGAGKAKLYARIMDELPAEARRPDFEKAIKEVERLSHNDGPLDHRSVDTRDSFAEGKSIRAMANECGLLDLYRQAYSMASGVAHSEWWSIETHAMERCLNVTHGGHLIASLSLSAGGNVDLATSWVDQFYALVRQSLRILGTDATAVAAAFSWLEDDGAAEPEKSPNDGTNDVGGIGTA